MLPRNKWLVGSLFGGFALGLLTMVLAGVGGVALVDGIRSYVAGEGFYSKAQKAAVIALHRYARSGDQADFSAYSRLIQVPLNDARARKILEDPSRPRSESHPYLVGGNNHPDDVAILSWLFRLFGETELFEPSIRMWRQANQKVLELQAVAQQLHQAIRAGPADAGEISAYLWRIDEIDDDLTALETGFSESMGDAARRVRTLVYLGIAGLALVLAILVAVFVAHSMRRFNAVMLLIRHREERFRDIAEVAADWIWETDAAFRFTYLSDRLEEVTGLPKEDFLGKRRWDLQTEPCPAGWAAHVASLERREAIENFEYSVSDADGLMRSFRINGKPVFADDGTFLGYRGTGTDITSEVRAQQEAQQKHELLETSFENLGQGISVVDANLNVVFFNRRFLDLLALPADLFAIGDPLEKFIRYHAERGEYGAVDLGQAVASRLADAAQFKPHDVVSIRPDGTVLAIHGHPLPSGGFVTTYRDVTSEHRAKKALIQSEQETRQVIDRALDAYIGMNQDETIIDWNPAAEQIFGWSREEAIGRRLAELIMPPRYRDAHQKAVRAYLKKGTGEVIGRRLELQALRRNGEVFPIELTVNAQSAGGTIVFNAFVRDITERSEAERKLNAAKEAAEAANRTKSEFLATMSHELRTPLNAIIGFADVMAQKLMGPIIPRYVEYAHDIRTSGDHLLSLINDILDISAVEAGKATIEPVPVDLRAIADTCLSLTKHAAEGRSVTVVNEVANDLPRLMADPRRLRQILLNLIGNAVKFSQPGASVFVRASLDGASMTINIVDSGPGIPAHEVERVFEAFVQLSAGQVRSHEGAGLGLALVKRFVELHGGTIKLDSHLGQGTTARITLPVLDDDAVPDKSRQSNARPTKREPKCR